MAHPFFSLPSVCLVFLLSIAALQSLCLARRPTEHPLLHSTSKLAGRSTQSYSNGGDGSMRPADGVIHSTPAQPMPSFNRNAAPVPLPEFPSLGPPVVWSFPAAPLPATEDTPPPPYLPAPSPRAGSKHASAPSPCGHGGGGSSIHHLRLPSYPPAIPSIAAEPAINPGAPLHAPESAPEPTAGGPTAPPY